MYSYKEILKRLNETNVLEKYKKEKLIEIIKKLDTANINIDLDYLSNIIFDSAKLGFKLNEHKPIDYNNIKLLSILSEHNDLKSFSSANKNDLDNFLILGDNLDALRNLSICYEGDDFSGIDLIYIDPPYNTINSQSYENKFDYNDWLFEIKEKLILSRDILKNNGSIMISIDDNMHAYLKVICDEIFGEENFLGNFVVGLVPSGRKNKAIAKIHEYVVVYCKDHNCFEGYFNEPSGKYDSFIREGSNSKINERPKRFYPIVKDKDNNLFPITKEEYDFIHSNNEGLDDEHLIQNILKKCEKIKSEYIEKGYEVFLPQKKDKNLVWQNEYKRFSDDYNKLINIFKNNEYIKMPIYKWDDKKGIIYTQMNSKPLSIWVSKTTVNDNFEENSDIQKNNDFENIASSNGKKIMKEIFLKNEINDEYYFSSPKPLSFMKKLIQIATQNNPNALILDYFGGSGTTAHAVMDLNAEDRKRGKIGNRRFILCTRIIENFKEENSKKYKTINVGKICYERIYRIMNGKPSNNLYDLPNWCKENEPYGGNLNVYFINNLSIGYNDNYSLDCVNKNIYEKIAGKEIDNNFDLINKIFKNNLVKE